MNVLFTVHGIVQGVGYRWHVKSIAKQCNIAGYVKNMPDGSVEIFAIGAEKDIKNFEDKINVYLEYGIKVMHIERMENAVKGSESKIPRGTFEIIR